MSDIVLLGVSRTSKTPTSIYLANRGYKTINIPLIPNQKIPSELTSQNLKSCVIGLYADPQRLSDIRRNRVELMNKENIKNYTDLDAINVEVQKSKQLFKKFNWPTIDVTRKSVEETAASIIKIYEIRKSKMKLILASKSGVRKKILDDNSIECDVVHSNVDEDQAKESFIEMGADPLIISKNLAELKSVKVSLKHPDRIVLGADSVISHNDKLINKPKSREEALSILKRLNNSTHFLISSVCISKNGSMIWNHTDKSKLKMKNLSLEQIKTYLENIKTEILLSYGVYQIEAGGLDLFDEIEGDKKLNNGASHKINKEILRKYKMKRFFIIGNPISHSLSPTLHNYWFRKYNIEAEYGLLEAKEDEIKNVMNRILKRRF